MHRTLGSRPDRVQLIRIAFFGLSVALSTFAASALQAQEAPFPGAASPNGDPLPADLPGTTGGVQSGPSGAGALPALVYQPSVYVDPRWPWTARLPYHPIPPLGNSPVLPTGPGYYSLLDCLTGNYRQNAPQSPYPPYALMRNSFFDADFRYLDDPNYKSEDFFDRFHNVHLGDDWLFGTGGQADWRHMHQDNARLSGQSDDFDLLRARVYTDLWYQDLFRFYVEVITATTKNQDLAPLKTDEDHFDFLNLFIGLKVAEVAGGPAYLRIGRQELLFGSERLITPLEWANTRQTFQGARLLWSNDSFDFDAWWVQPVIPNNTGFSSVDDKQEFYGTWLTYHPDKKQWVDFYWLYLSDNDQTTSMGITQAPTSVHTLGMRYTGEKNNFLWDFEPDLQVGERGSQSILAGAVSTGVGYNWPDFPMNPTIWAYYDWASGDHDPGHGDYSTFNQLFGFGHYYLGFMDLIGRENIRDWNVQIYLYPTKWISFNLQYHILNLDSARDALYGPSGSPERVNLNGAAGGDVGQELTFITNFHLGPHSDVLVGWSKMYEGTFLNDTAKSGQANIATEMFYFMYNIRW